MALLVGLGLWHARRTHEDVELLPSHHTESKAA